jgi:monoamine oxidase
MTIDEPDWWDQWTYFDEESGETKLKEDAPADVKREWTELQKLMNYE